MITKVAFIRNDKCQQKFSLFCMEGSNMSSSALRQAWGRWEECHTTASTYSVDLVSPEALLHSCLQFTYFKMGNASRRVVSVAITHVLWLPCTGTACCDKPFVRLCTKYLVWFDNCKWLKAGLPLRSSAVQCPFTACSRQDAFKRSYNCDTTVSWRKEAGRWRLVYRCVL